MSTLVSGIISGFFRSYVFDLAEVSKDWFIGKRLVFRAAALFVYAFALLVVLVVVVTVAFVSYPLSQVYRVFS